MTSIQRDPERLVVRSGSTAIVLDKGAGKAVLQRKLLLWERKPVERPLSAITNVRVNSTVDPASKAEICSTMVVMQGGGWVLSARDKDDATAAVAAIRDFLNLAE
jgi:hypothetical protein